MRERSGGEALVWLLRCGQRGMQGWQQISREKTTKTTTTAEAPYRLVLDDRVVLRSLAHRGVALWRQAHKRGVQQHRHQRVD